MKSGFSYRLLYVISSPRLFSLLLFQLILNYWFMRFRLFFSFFFPVSPLPSDLIFNQGYLDQNDRMIVYDASVVYVIPAPFSCFCDMWKSTPCMDGRVFCEFFVVFRVAQRTRCENAFFLQFGSRYASGFRSVCCRCVWDDVMQWFFARMLINRFLTLWCNFDFSIFWTRWLLDCLGARNYFPDYLSHGNFVISCLTWIRFLLFVYCRVFNIILYIFTINIFFIFFFLVFFSYIYLLSFCFLC